MRLKKKDGWKKERRWKKKLWRNVLSMNPTCAPASTFTRLHTALLLFLSEIIHSLPHYSLYRLFCGERSSGKRGRQQTRTRQSAFWLLISKIIFMIHTFVHFLYFSWEFNMPWTDMHLFYLLTFFSKLSKWVKIYYGK